MRESALVARVDESGREVLVVHRPVAFTLDEAALAMHAVVDAQLAKLSSRNRVGRSRVRDVLRTIALEGWPERFEPDQDRVNYWKKWLVTAGVFARAGSDPEPA